MCEITTKKGRAQMDWHFAEIRKGLESQFKGATILHIDNAGQYVLHLVRAFEQNVSGAVVIEATKGKTIVPLRRIVKVSHPDKVKEQVLNTVLHEYKTYLLDENAREICELRATDAGTD